jgi:hypothetical protein
MLEIIILWVFALYGFWSIIRDIIELKKEKSICNGEIEVIIKVCNQENSIAELVKKLVNYIPDDKFIIKDLGSIDSTYDILLKLKEEYKGLKIERI